MIDVKSEQFKKFQQIPWLEKTKKYKGGAFKRMKKRLDHVEVTFYKSGFVIQFESIKFLQMLYYTNHPIITYAFPILSLY